MGRIERGADDNPLGVLARRLHHAWRYPRRARGDDGIDGRRFIHVREQLHFEVRPLGAVFLDEVGRRERPPTPAPIYPGPITATRLMGLSNAMMKSPFRKARNMRCR